MTLGVAIQHGSVVLGKYRVESILGRGGMGIVVQARHLALDELVAIKLLRDDVTVDEETRARFLREAQAAAKLRSQHVARIIDVGEFEVDKPYMVMEFLEGQDLGALIKERGKLHPSLAIDLVIQTCDALAEAHALGIVHRDIKPTNLFLTSHPDGTLLLKVLDFGISKATNGVDLSLTQTASMLGTPAYMSPEQMRSARRVDTRTDIWSLGSVLYEALEGHLPFQAESFSEMCVMVAVDPPAPMVAAPPSLAPIIARCLAKHPDQRYQNVAELARDLAIHAREPERARILVDRMFRMLGRARQSPPILTPPVGVNVVSAQLASPTSPTVGTVAAPSSLVMSQMRVAPKRRPLLIGVVAVLVIGAGAIGYAVTRDDDDKPAAAGGSAATVAPATTTGRAAPGTDMPATHAGSADTGRATGDTATGGAATGSAATGTATTSTATTGTTTGSAAPTSAKIGTASSNTTPSKTGTPKSGTATHLTTGGSGPRKASATPTTKAIESKHTTKATEQTVPATEAPNTGKGSDKPSSPCGDPFENRKGC